MRFTRVKRVSGGFGFAEDVGDVNAGPGTCGI
jgi:hypothetical protein